MIHQVDVLQEILEAVFPVHPVLAVLDCKGGPEGEGPLHTDESGPGRAFKSPEVFLLLLLGPETPPPT